MSPPGSEQQGAAARPRWASALEPPPCPDGWSTAPPDFVGVGAQRSGTSWWYQGAIKSHPGVVQAEGRRKELHFFDRFWNRDAPEDIGERYAEFFPRPPGTLSGEWTPRYLCDFWSLRLLRQAAPEARILVMLRDPVERYRSGISRDLALAEEAGRPLTLASVSASLWRSYYGDQMRRLFALFPREQVLVLQFERCRAEPIAEMEATCRFLELDPPPEPPARLLRHRAPKHGKTELPDSIRADLVAQLRDDVSRLAALCPEIDVSLWPNFRG